MHAFDRLTVLNFSFGQSRNAPPDAVRIIFFSPPGGKPCRHWKIALCSESAGSILTLYVFNRGTTTGPPAMRVSLLASAMSLPALMAATVGNKPAHPTIPTQIMLPY